MSKAEVNSGFDDRFSHLNLLLKGYLTGEGEDGERKIRKMRTTLVK